MEKSAAKYADPWSTAGTAISDDGVLPLDRGLYWMVIDWDNRNGTVTSPAMPLIQCCHVSESANPLKSHPKLPGELA